MACITLGVLLRPGSLSIAHVIITRRAQLPNTLHIPPTYDGAPSFPRDFEGSTPCSAQLRIHRTQGAALDRPQLSGLDDHTVTAQHSVPHERQRYVLPPRSGVRS